MSKLEELIQKLCPDGVEYNILGNLGKFYGGLSGKSKNDFIDGNAKFITYMNVYKNIELKLDITETVKVEENERQHAIEYGDILFTGSSENMDECGLASVLTKCTSEKLYLNSFCFGFRFNNSNIMLPSFSKYVFRSSKVRKQIMKTASGVTRYNVSKKKMENVAIPVPPIEIQNEIVRILDKFTELTTELATELTTELKARKEQYEYYREKMYFFYKNTNYKSLNEIAINCDSQRKPITSGNRVVGEYPYYGASGVIDHVKDYIFDGNYLLISEDGANLVVRKTPIAFSIEGKSWVNNHAHVLKFNNILLQQYVEMYLNSIDLSKYISGAAQPKLNQENLNKILIPVPNDKKIEKTVEILNKFKKLINDIEEGLPAEIEARQKQYEYYRDKLLNFKELKVEK